ncbi:MAG: hypothetical protein KBD01_10250 [Acidobacteria bacterium]|nr:hypothetical protein [Acidobacteriota bacterium]
MNVRIRFRGLILVLVFGGLAGASAWLPAQAADCNGNEIEDGCDISCGPPGGPCDVPGCGTAADCDGNGIPDSCDLASNGAGCHFTNVLASNSTTGPDANFTGPPDDVYYGLGGQQVTYHFDCGFVADGAGPDFNVYEVDSGAAEFTTINVFVSVNGVDFVSVYPSMGARVDIDGDEAHGNASFARGFDLAGTGYPAVRYIRIDGNGTGGSGPSTGFDLDAIGVIHRLGRDCDADGTLDACQDRTDCDADGAPDACVLAAGIFADCNTNGALDFCDAGTTSQDCDANHRPDECQADCNANSRPDSCDIADLTSPDCNANQIPDECDLAFAGTVDAGSDRLRPFGNGYPVSFTILSPFPAWGPVTLSVTAAGDLNAADEYISVTLNGVSVGRLFESGGAQCTAAVGTLLIDAPVFNEAVANGNAAFTFTATSAVNKEECPENWLEAEVTYDASVDCDASSTIDHCEIDAFPGEDLNRNGVLDNCESDCNLNGNPDDYDVEQGLSADCNGNRLPDECDIAGATSTDCDGNGVPDECQPDCNGNGIADPCDIGAGTSLDCDANTVPDECDLAAAGPSCPFPVTVVANTTGGDSARFTGPPNDSGWGLGGQIVTLEWTCGRIVDGPGPDLTIYETDSGTDEFEQVSVEVSLDGVTFQNVTGSMVAGVRIPGDATHGGILFRRSFDLAWAGMRQARFVRLDGAGTGGGSSSAGFDLDAVGAIHVVDRDCNDSGGLDACESPADCDANGLPDSCQLAAVAGSDCNANTIPDACDIAGGGSDCDSDGVLDLCEPDCNGNAIADACDIAALISPDCNGNLRPDECDAAVLAAAETSPALAPVGTGYAGTFTILRPPTATGPVTVTVQAQGDFDAASESLTISLNGTAVGTVFDTTSAFCTAIIDSMELTADQYNNLVQFEDAVFTATASSSVGPFECEGSFVTFVVSYPAEPDCNANAVPDSCDIANITASDCNNNGVLDVCDVASGTSDDCNDDDIPDECPLCPPVKVVFVMDTSTSMTDEGAVLCSSITQVAADLEAELVDVESELLGIMAPGTGQFACLTDSVANLYGTDVPGEPPPDNQTLGACPGGNEVGSEDWGRATSVVAGNKPWPVPSVRLVVPIGDEGPWCGDPVSDPGVDRDSINHAIQISVLRDVVASPITGSGSSTGMKALAQNLADATGGEAFSSQIPAEDLAAGIEEIVRNACRAVVDCNRNDRPDDCDIADGTSHDCDFNDRPDECEADCNGNGINDVCDVRVGLSDDDNGNNIPDECEWLVLTLDAANLNWTEVYGTIGYDVVRGGLGVLLETAGDFTAALNSCVVNDTIQSSWPHGVDPAAGSADWFLARAVLGTGPLSYDILGGGQVGTRDAEIAAAPDACP